VLRAPPLQHHSHPSQTPRQHIPHVREPIPHIIQQRILLPHLVPDIDGQPLQSRHLIGQFGDAIVVLLFHNVGIGVVGGHSPATAVAVAAGFEVAVHVVVSSVLGALAHLIEWITVLLWIGFGVVARTLFHCLAAVVRLRFFSWVRALVEVDAGCSLRCGVCLDLVNVLGLLDLFGPSFMFDSREREILSDNWIPVSLHAIIGDRTR